MEAWESEAARRYRSVFKRREQAYGRAFSDIDGDMDLIKFRRIMEGAARAMPKAPEGCDRCHYLYGV
jgi:hypothetical protein